MGLFWFLAWLAGLAGVVQNGLNKRLATQIGLAGTLHVSNLIVLIGGVLILTSVAGIGHGDFPQLLKIKLNLRNWSWWILLPGLMGLFIITIAPYAIVKIGALQVFVAMVFGQVLGSAVWDYFFEGRPVDVWRVAGCLLTLAGAYVITFSKAGA